MNNLGPLVDSIRADLGEKEETRLKLELELCSY
jgi:hypothetical protein